MFVLLGQIHFLRAVISIARSSSVLFGVILGCSGWEKLLKATLLPHSQGFQQAEHLCTVVWTSSQTASSLESSLLLL